MRRIVGIALILIQCLTLSCDREDASHQEMLNILKQLQERYNQSDNYYASDAHVRYYDSLISISNSDQDKLFLTHSKARALIASGREDEAVEILWPQMQKIIYEKIQGMDRMKVTLALAYLRSGERMNCVRNHSAETCIMPIQGSGVHTVPDGSRNAVRIYEELLRKDPQNLEYRWLLNIAYMTLGEYPARVPQALLLPGLEVSTAQLDSGVYIKPFQDMASPLSLDINNMAGGCIIDDFDNDGFLDIVTSAWSLDEPMHYFKNNGDGSFSDRSAATKLNALTGGLNIMQMDYNNDGFKDIFVLRGAWLRGNYGRQPNSLLKNNGDGTFTDVTIASGILSLHPTQTATWNDFNNDGWLDVFIGNESWEGNAISGLHPAELFISNQDGTFTNVAAQAHVELIGFVKGVTSGDYNNDGWKDIFVTSISGERFLLKNKGTAEAIPIFEDATKQAHVAVEGISRTFPTWFWDYNNDGWLDIFVGDYTFEKAISTYSAAEALNIPTGTAGAGILYRNNQDGTFTNVSQEVGLVKKAFTMGANFGDIDNDGYLDMYLGTGNPELESIVPNKLFKNIAGKRFADVTAPARVGHLQKGHAISFADVDNDGDQDIYIELGGAFKGDAFHNSFYVNPNQDERNKWIVIDLVGRKTNRSAIGSRIKVTFTEDGRKRSVYREVNSGGSFGASPLRKEIGIGHTEIIDEIEIQWHPGTTQVFKNIRPNQFLRIEEGSDVIELIPARVFRFNAGHSHVHTYLEPGTFEQTSQIAICK
ncbi:MAG TPA: CRTAC1 family protein [Ohtaekwangia sp.]